MFWGVKDNEGQTPLHYAVNCDETRCVEALLKLGAKSDIEDKNHQTAKSIASKEASKAVQALFRA